MKTTNPTQFDKDCAEIARLTDINDHTGALIKLAQMVEHDKYMKMLHHIKELHQLEGHLTHHLAEMRQEIRYELRKIAEREYTPDKYSKIWGAF